jgi:hypothetical protein
MSSSPPTRKNYQAMISRLSQALHPDKTPIEKKQAFEQFAKELEKIEIVRGDEVISTESFLKEWTSWVDKGNLNLWDGRDYPADVRSDMIETMVDLHTDHLRALDLKASQSGASNDILSADIDGSILKPYDHGFGHAKIMTREDMLRIMTRDDLTAQQKWNILTRDDCWGLLTRDDIKNILTRDDFRRILTRDDIKKILTRDDLLTEELRDILTRDDLSPGEVMDILTRDDLLAQIMTREDMLSIMTREDILSTIMTRSDIMKPVNLADLASASSMSGGMAPMKMQRKAPDSGEVDAGGGNARIGELPGDRLELETPQGSDNIPRVGVAPAIEPVSPAPKARISNVIITGSAVVGIALGAVLASNSWVRPLPPQVDELRFPGIAAGCVVNGECEDSFGEDEDNCPADCEDRPSFSIPEQDNNEPEREPTDTPIGPGLERQPTDTPIGPGLEKQSDVLVEYEADTNEIGAYECFTLNWYAENVAAVTFGGITDKSPPLEGDFTLCNQCETKTYPITVTYHDGRQEKFYQTIRVVSGSCAGADTPNEPPDSPDSPAEPPPQDSPDDPTPHPICGSGYCGDYTCGNSWVNDACENRDNCPQDCAGGVSSWCSRDMGRDACESAGGGYVPSSMEGPYCSCPP